MHEIIPICRAPFLPLTLLPANNLSENPFSRHRRLLRGGRGHARATQLSALRTAWSSEQIPPPLPAHRPRSSASSTGERQPTARPFLITALLLPSLSSVRSPPKKKLKHTAASYGCFKSGLISDCCCGSKQEAEGSCARSSPGANSNVHEETIPRYHYQQQQQALACPALAVFCAPLPGETAHTSVHTAPHSDTLIRKEPAVFLKKCG